MNKYLKTFILLFSIATILAVAIFLLAESFKTAKAQVSVTARVGVEILPACSDTLDNDGDGLIDYPSDPGCSSSSDNDEYNAPSGGGGGGGGIPPSIQTAVIFRGLAYPKSTITLLKDAQVAAATPASPDASFQITISNITGGIYSFGVWAEDSKGIRSITQTFTVSVASGVTTVVSGIFLPPTINIDKSEVKKGDILNIFGFSAPKAQVSVFVNSDEEIMEKTSTDNSGVWLHKFDTSAVDKGDHSTRARSSLNGDISVYSQLAFFKVGDKNVTAGGQGCRVRADLNGDCKVNLIDFSILAYWYNRPLTDAAKNKVDLNTIKDGKVDLIDFSIMAYYWTG